MRSLFFASAATLISVQLVSAAVINIPAGNVTASSEIGAPFNRQDDFIVDGSGLTGLQHNNTVEPNMWLSTGTSFGGIDPDPSMLFDLGAVYTINSFQVWNYNEVVPGSGINLTNRGVNGVTVNFGATAALGSTVAGITNFAQADGTATYAGEVFDNTDFTPFNARFIQFDIASGVGVGNHGDGNTFYGLSEVQFDGVLVPEPGSAALLGLGAIALLFRRRKR